MKYQHIVNKEILFETDEVGEFFEYLVKSTNSSTIQARHSILYNLLDKNNGYICNMVTK